MVNSHFSCEIIRCDYNRFCRRDGYTDRVAVITTKPLTEEAGWTEFKRGELIMFDKGLPYRTPKCCEAVEKEGRGLSSKYITLKSNRSPTCSSVLRAPVSPPRLMIPSASNPCLAALETSPPLPSLKEIALDEQEYLWQPWL
jgi:hypothetical protein